MELKKCPMCGRMVESTMTQCFTCGTDFEQFEKIKNIKEESKDDGLIDFDEPLVINEAKINYDEMNGNMSAGTALASSSKAHKTSAGKVLITIFACLAVAAIVYSFIMPVIMCSLAESNLEDLKYDDAKSKLVFLKHSKKANDLYTTAEYEYCAAQAIMSGSMLEGMFGGNFESSTKIKVEEIRFFINPDRQKDDLLKNRPIIAAKVDLSETTGTYDHRVCVYMWGNTESGENYLPISNIAGSLSSYLGGGQSGIKQQELTMEDLEAEYEKADIDVNIDRINRLIKKASDKMGDMGLQLQE